MLIAPFAFLFVAALSPDSARIIDGRVFIEPVGVSFELPPYWRDSAYRVAHKREGCGANAPGVVYSAPSRQRPDLASARGEWDADYSTVADSVLSLDDLVVHAGAERWSAGSCYSDLQVRLYVVHGQPADVMSRVEQTGRRTADRRFTSSYASSDSSGWAIGRLSWRAFYLDYGSTARMEYYTRSVGDRTVVLLFMFADAWGKGNLEDKKAILDSWR